MRRIYWMILLGAGALACDDGAEAPPVDAAPEDAAQTFDVALVDRGSGCTPRPEICNGIDDDCDGLVDDDDPDIQRVVLDDPANCGACGVVCAAPNAELVCQAGACVIVACAPGFGDYNGQIEDGCETDCVITAGGVERCDGLDNDCDGQVDEGFDLATDVAHCGGCGQACAAVDNAEVRCVGGACAADCRPGFHDLDGAPGCEYACVPRATAEIREYCNGLDDDCDGLIDEAPDRVEPPGGCGELGVCAPECDGQRPCGAGDRCAEGVCVAAEGGPEGRACREDADCQALHPGYACVAQSRRVGQGVEHFRACQPRLRRPMCDGEAGYRCARHPSWQFGNEIGRCDGLDNDCDGRTDEDFAARLLTDDLQDPRPCVAGLGVCQREGLAACAPDGQAVICTAEAGAPLGPDDQCDGVDDDCDGQVDEAFPDALVPLPGGGAIFAFEASRPGASAAAAGVDLRPHGDGLSFAEDRACSRGGVLPWADVTFDQAAAACAAAGFRLCTAREWGLACGGPQREGFPYGAIYDRFICNGGEYDVDPDTRGVQSGLLPTGAAGLCERGGAYDLSGNLKEWIDAPVGPLVQVRGGGYQSNIPEALACGLEDDLKVPEFRHPSLGFRCCTD